MSKTALFLQSNRKRRMFWQKRQAHRSPTRLFYGKSTLGEAKSEFSKTEKVKSCEKILRFQAHTIDTPSIKWYTNQEGILLSRPQFVLSSSAV